MTAVFTLGVSAAQAAVGKMRAFGAMTLADLLGKIERGQIGHAAAMKWLGVKSINELVAIVHANGRQMWGHRARAVSPETREVLHLVTRKQRSKKAI